MAVRADDVDLVRDRSLVELCQAGDHRAFGDLYDRYYNRLFRFCLRRVGNAHEAEEITQEAFARAFSAIPRFAGERRFYPWLTVIASRLCIDSHRRVARTEPTAEVDLGGVEGGQQQVLDNVDLAYLAQALEQLGPRHREVLELRETHGWTYQQIADHFSVTMGTVEALLFRARKALRREFLALAGEEHRLASIPLLGAAYRGLVALRARLNEFSHNALPAAAASAAGVAAVAGSFGLGSAIHHPSAAHAPQAVKVQAVSVAATPVPVQTTGGTAGSATQLLSPNPPGTPPASLAVVEGDAADGKARTATDASQIRLGGLTISNDLTRASGLDLSDK